MPRFEAVVSYLMFSCQLEKRRRYRFCTHPYWYMIILRFMDGLNYLMGALYGTEQHSHGFKRYKMY